MRGRLLLALGVLTAFVAVSSRTPAFDGTVPGGRGLLTRGASAQSAAPFCDVTPLGALVPAKATWCDPTTSGNPTFISGTNSWVDEFNHGLTNAAMGPGYLLYEPIGNPGSLYKVQHFRHQNHWMVDVAPTSPAGAGGWGFAAMRPDRSFIFQNGTLTVEAAVAAGIQDYIDNIWPEVVVSDAPAPTHSIDDLYLYGQFGGRHAFGCRLDPERYAICDLKNDKPNTPQDDHASQTYQVSRTVCPTGATCSGGYGAAQTAWRSCAGTDPDTNCRDLFRLELTATTFKLYVNGVLNLQASGLPPLPPALLAGPIYAYFGQTVFQESAARVVRFHWDRLAVNTVGASPSPTPAPTTTPTPTPTPTPRPSTTPTPTPTATPTPTSTPTPTPSPTPRPSTTPAPTSTPTPSPVALAAPSDLTARAPSGRRVDLTWTDNSTGESGFAIERSTNGSTFTEIGTVAAGATTFSDTSVQPFRRYYYRVRAYGTGAPSPYSDMVSLLTPFW